MLQLLLAPLLTKLAESGLGLLSSAIQAKGKEVIEKTIGMKIPDNPTEKDLPELRQAMMLHEERLLELAIEKSKLSIEQDMVDNANTSSARDMNSRIQESINASTLAKIAPYVLDFIIITSTLILVSLIMFKTIPGDNKELAYMALGALLTMCGTILNFHRGSSASSKAKDDTIIAMHGKGGI